MTTLIFNKTATDATSPVNLMYGDVIKIEGIRETFYSPEEEYFIIAQTGYGQMTLFQLTIRNSVDIFNRVVDPVSVSWCDLDTNSIKSLLPWEVSKVSKVNATITISVEK